MVADKGKKLKVAEKLEEKGSESIVGKLLVSVEKLQEIQDELETINEEASDKVLEVEQKYNEIRRPVYDKRTEMIKSIPDFWLTAFLSHPALGELLNEEDQKIFKHLSSLEVEDFKDVKSGYSITLHFNPNPYFEDTNLTKTFTYADDDGTTKITATSIKWKEGMGIPNGINHEKKGNKRPASNESFFSWFTDTQEKDHSDIHDEMKKTLMTKRPLKRERMVMTLKRVRTTKKMKMTTMMTKMVVKMMASKVPLSGHSFMAFTTLVMAYVR
ncbi:NAP1-related protein 1-like isoform X4 [Carya illinoinensis]|uniref:NAP1-related protein 1-like isoform X4 n=1 Tax=Carya illinoinensis TaxID=32201 RepID=UPI001C72434B|nr:NAP1-related protein 1-like isoform X4 [Carya illinoinensis]